MRVPVRVAILLLPLADCGAKGNLVGGAASVIALAELGCTVPDAVRAGLTGDNCPMVNLAQGKPWCRAAEPPPPAQPFCTRSLGTVDCWASAADQPLPARIGVADGRGRLIAAQERDRTTGWLGHRLPAPDDPPGR